MHAADPTPPNEAPSLERRLHRQVRIWEAIVTALVEKVDVLRELDERNRGAASRRAYGEEVGS